MTFLQRLREMSENFARDGYEKGGRVERPSFQFQKGPSVLLMSPRPS